MIHSTQHPDAGKLFQVKFPGDVKAMADTRLQGRVVQLVDWADRMYLDNKLSVQQSRVFLSFYQHRWLMSDDDSAIENMPLDDAVYAVLHNSDGSVVVDTIVLNLAELTEV